MEIIVTKETLLLKPGRHDVGDSLGMALIQNGFAEEYKVKRPQKWEEIVPNLKGWFVSNSEVIEFAIGEAEDHFYFFRDVYPTKEEAEAVIAMAQLSQLRDVYNNGWKPDWSDSSYVKWCIQFENNKLIIDTWYTTHQWLCFETAELAQEFVENFKDLILIAKPYI